MLKVLDFSLSFNSFVVLFLIQRNLLLYMQNSVLTSKLCFYVFQSSQSQIVYRRMNGDYNADVLQMLAPITPKLQSQLLMKLSPSILNTLQNSLRMIFSSHTPRPYTGKSYEEVRAERKYVSPIYTHYYKEPFFPVEGHKEFLYDQDGRQYIDLIGGISCMNVGHSHPRITKIYQEQSQTLMNLSSHYVHQYQGMYAEKLCQELGEGFDTAFFFNSGSESNDFAYNLAKAYTRNNVVVALRGGYHGTVGNAYDLTSIGSWTTPLSKGSALERLAWPNYYKNPHLTVDSLLADAQEQLDSNTSGKVAGIFLEPVLGASGIIPLVPQYAQRLQKLVRKMGGLYISDQVQAGFGRIGKEKWGFKYLGVKPDIVVMAKAIANGIPFSAVVTRRQIAQSLSHDYFSTYSGSPLDMRIACQVLDIINDEKLPEHVEELNTYLLGEFKRIQKKSKIIGDVRGKGMFIAVEFVKDLQTKQPNPDACAIAQTKGRQMGILFGKGGYKGQLFRMLGPLCLSKQTAVKVVAIFEQLVEFMEKQP